MAVCVLLGISLAAASLWPPPVSAATAVPNSALPTVDQLLAREKVRAEIRQIQLANSQNADWAHDLLAWAPFLTAIVGVIALGATLWKQSAELGTARTQLMQERNRDREAASQWQQDFVRTERETRQQREAEDLRRFDSNLAQIITNLGAAELVLRVNAAAAIATYLKPRYRAFHCDILTVIAANLRLRPPDQVARMLCSDLERVLRLISESPEAYRDELPPVLDLARATLTRVTLSDLALPGVLIDVAFADLTSASLVGCNLFRLRGREAVMEKARCSRTDLQEARLNGARCRGAQMHETNLVSATFRDADLRDVEFCEARLQEAHFEGARLEGANFRGADLANAYFWGATFDSAAIDSIARGARRWQGNRHFDPAVRQSLDAAVPA